MNYPPLEIILRMKCVGSFVGWRNGTFVGSTVSAMIQLDQVDGIAAFLRASKNPRDLKLFPKLIVLGCHAFFHHRHRRRIGFIHSLPREGIKHARSYPQ